MIGDIQEGEVWEMYSTAERRWVLVIVTKLDNEDVTLRHEGVLEFLTVRAEEMRDNPERFRPVGTRAPC